MASSTTKTAHRKILIVAEHRIGHGSGHLHRCARLVPKLEGQVDWLLPASGSHRYYGRNEALRMIGNPDLPVRWVDAPEGPYDIAILDRREISLSELKSMNITGISVGIDLAGEGRRYCSYLIDALESPPEIERPNISDSGLLHLPETIRPEWPERAEKVLVALGGEQVGNGSDFASELARRMDSRVYLAVRESVPAPDNVILLEAGGHLQERLADFDLVITHYGLTAYEALWARVPVVLKNPGRYHKVLSRAAGFLETASVPDVVSSVSRWKELVERCRRIRPNGESDMATLINELHIPRRLTPPGGGDRWQPSIQRFAERTFFRNGDDNLVYMQSFRQPTVQYSHDYFFSDYARQYGKTYLEDFPAIKQTGMRRIRDILKKAELPKEGRPPRILDIGCAYGPFLQAAAEAGCEVHGIDISCEAARYVREELGFSARCGDVLSPDMEDLGGPFDIITMWYVIEHFQDLDVLLRRVTKNLAPGGLFAFSTPSSDGISGRRDIREFYRRSPEDHYTVLSPSTVAAVLGKFNLYPRSVKITGHHPERFPLVPPVSEGRTPGFRHRMAGAWSRLARLGDTFEVVAEYRP
jgi:2-polyprenyl-3-methyl-5-hydroxy-6-metoxy-1,4-benzoquinol methylase